MSDSTLNAIIIAVPPTLAALSSLFVSLVNRKKLQTVHLAMNGRLDELLAITRTLAHTEGMAAQRKKDRERKENK